MRPLSVLLLATLVLLAAGCSLILPQSGPAVGGGGVAPGVAPGEALPFPECQTGEYAFAGESTLAAIGLGDFAGGPDANKVGMIWVTAGPVAMGGPPGGPGLPPDMPVGRMVCVQWPDGSGMAGTIPDDWVPPAVALGSGPSGASGGPPVALLALVAGAVVVVGVSVVAFRREPA